jgi:hypothetical protein
MDFERTFTVGVGADAAFAYLADPVHLPDYLPTVAHVDSIAIDGADDPDADTEAAGEPTRFLPDAGARRIEWGRPGSDYEGSFTVEPGTTSTSQVTIRLHLRDDAPAEEIERMLAQAARSIGSKVRGY